MGLEIPEVSDDVVADFNEGMAKIARHSKREDLTPLTFQLSTTWEEAIPDERKTCLEKATSLTNSRGSRVQCRGRGSKVAVAGPMSRQGKIIWSSR